MNTFRDDLLEIRGNVRHVLVECVVAYDTDSGMNNRFRTSSDGWCPADDSEELQIRSSWVRSRGCYWCRSGNRQGPSPGGGFDDQGTSKQLAATWKLQRSPIFPTGDSEATGVWCVSCARHQRDAATNQFIQPWRTQVQEWVSCSFRKSIDKIRRFPRAGATFLGKTSYV